MATDRAATGASDESWRAWPLLVLVAVVVGQGLAFRWAPVDDAYISFRYARNLAEGHGLVFNLGERVEGYTNFLWTLLLALAGRAGVDMVAAGQWLGVVFACVALWLTWRIGRHVAAEREWPVHAAWVAPTLLALYPGWAYWAFAGLEGPLLTCLVLAFLRVALSSLPVGEGRRAGRPTAGTEAGRYRTEARSSEATGGAAAGCDRGAEGSAVGLVAAGVCAALAAMTRPETVLIWIVPVAAALLAEGRPLRSRVRAATILSVVPLSLFGAYFAWRYHYYGELLPNTFYAKMGAPLMSRLVRGTAYTGELAIGWLLPVSGLAWLAGPRGRWTGSLLLSMVIYVAYVTWTGGDFFPWLRFYLPVLPIAALFCADVIHRLARPAGGERPRPGACVLFTGALAVALAGVALRIDLPAARDHARWVKGWIEVGKWADRTLAPGDRLVLAPVGAIGYYARQPVIDVLGLTDHEIAHGGVTLVAEPPGHQRSNNASILRRRPEVVLGQAALFDAPPTEDQAIQASLRRALKSLYADPEFKSLYEYRVAQVGRRWLPYWVLKPSS